MKYILASLFLVVTGLKASDFLPSNILLLDQEFNHHVILVEKSTHRLLIYQNQDTFPELVKEFQVATGKIRGNKYTQGDHKTPEGIYTFNHFYSEENILGRYGNEVGKIYGIGAFTTNYPNLMDKRSGKTGGGIWLHSTDDDSRISKGLDSRGCVVAKGNDLIDISEFIDLKKTSIIISENINYLKKETWETQKNNLETFVKNWQNAWREKDFDAYINAYSKDEFFDKYKGDFGKFKAYKRSIFSRKEKPEINFSALSILRTQDYAVVTMKQDYSSDLIKDFGKKTLYLKQDKNYDWKIIAEEWSKIKENINTQNTKIKYFTNMANEESPR